MADPPRFADPRPHATPRWVKVFGIIAIVMVVLFVGLMIFGGGRHGPSRHTPSGDAGGQTPSAGGRR